jgi:hypothetical protein
VRAAFGLALNTPLVKARGAAATDDRGVSDSTLPTRHEGRQRPLWNERGVRHSGQAGVNRQAPWRGFEGDLGVRVGNHRGMGARTFQCRWQTSTECILALTDCG